MVCNRKSTLMAINTAPQTIPVNGFLEYTASSKTGCSINFTNGSNAIHLNCGLYQINVSAEVLGTDAGEGILQLLRNGAVIPGAEGGATLTVGDISNIAFSAIIDVPPSCRCVNNSTMLQIQLLNVAATVNNVVVTVVKLA